MRELTEVEYDILNVVYFVETYDKILEEVNYPANIVADSVKFLIRMKYISPMRLDPKTKDYVRSFMYDSDNMRAYRYIITREGLEAHNTRS
jgi:hypothetical protein